MIARDKSLKWCRETKIRPRKCWAFMEAFDNEQHVQPFSFTATFKSGEVDRDGKEQLHVI